MFAYKYEQKAEQGTFPCYYCPYKAVSEEDRKEHMRTCQGASFFDGF